MLVCLPCFAAHLPHPHWTTHIQSTALQLIITPFLPCRPPQEQRDALLGRIFGLGCVVRAGLASEPATAAAVADRLVAVAARKAFLREAATAVLLQLAQGLPDSGVASLVEDSAGRWLHRDRACTGCAVVACCCCWLAFAWERLR